MHPDNNDRVAIVRSSCPESMTEPTDNKHDSHRSINSKKKSKKSQPKKKGSHTKKKHTSSSSSEVKEEKSTTSLASDLKIEYDAVVKIQAIVRRYFQQTDYRMKKMIFRLGEINEKHEEALVDIENNKRTTIYKEISLMNKDKRIMMLVEQNEKLTKKLDLLNANIAKLKTKTSEVVSAKSTENQHCANTLYLMELQSKLTATNEKLEVNLGKYKQNVKNTTQSAVNAKRAYIIETKMKKVYVQCLTKTIVKIQEHGDEDSGALNSLVSKVEEVMKSVKSKPYHSCAGVYLEGERERAATKIQARTRGIIERTKLNITPRRSSGARKKGIEREQGKKHLFEEKSNSEIRRKSDPSISSPTGSPIDGARKKKYSALADNIGKIRDNSPMRSPTRSRSSTLASDDSPITSPTRTRSSSWVSDDSPIVGPKRSKSLHDSSPIKTPRRSKTSSSSGTLKTPKRSKTLDSLPFDDTPLKTPKRSKSTDLSSDRGRGKSPVKSPKTRRSTVSPSGREYSKTPPRRRSSVSSRKAESSELGIPSSIDISPSKSQSRRRSSVSSSMATPSSSKKGELSISGLPSVSDLSPQASPMKRRSSSYESDSESPRTTPVGRRHSLSTHLSNLTSKHDDLDAGVHGQDDDEKSQASETSHQSSKSAKSTKSAKSSASTKSKSSKKKKSSSRSSKSSKKREKVSRHASSDSILSPSAKKKSATSRSQASLHDSIDNVPSDDELGGDKTVASHLTKTTYTSRRAGVRRGSLSSISSGPSLLRTRDKTVIKIQAIVRGGIQRIKYRELLEKKKAEEKAKKAKEAEEKAKKEKEAEKKFSSSVSSFPSMGTTFAAVYTDDLKKKKELDETLRQTEHLKTPKKGRKSLFNSLNALFNSSIDKLNCSSFMKPKYLLDDGSKGNFSNTTKTTSYENSLTDTSYNRDIVKFDDSQGLLDLKESNNVVKSPQSSKSFAKLNKSMPILPSKSMPTRKEHDITEDDNEEGSHSLSIDDIDESEGSEGSEEEESDDEFEGSDGSMDFDDTMKSNNVSKEGRSKSAMIDSMISLDLNDSDDKSPSVYNDSSNNNSVSPHNQSSKKSMNYSSKKSLNMSSKKSLNFHNSRSSSVKQ